MRKTGSDRSGRIDRMIRIHRTASIDRATRIDRISRFDSWIGPKAGFVSLDALFSIIPLIMMVSLVLGFTSTLVMESAIVMHRQQVFDKLVSIADYSVEYGLAEADPGDPDGKKIPNLLDRSLLTDAYMDDLKGRSGLGALHISLDNPSDDADNCIYRLVVEGDERAIKRLFVCGS